MDRAKRFARCGSSERARVVAERTREAWAAHARGGPRRGEEEFDSHHLMGATRETERSATDETKTF